MKNGFVKKSIRHLRWFIRSVMNYFALSRISNATCVFISHNGDGAGGAPVVLFELIRELQDRFEVLFLCEKPGEINAMCRKARVPAYSFYGLSCLFFRKIRKKNVRFVFINTMASYKAINYFGKINNEIPVFLWVHEEDKLIDRYARMLSVSDFSRMQILCVSASVEKHLVDVLPATKGKTSLFFYGCVDKLSAEETRKEPNGKFIISVIGRICPRKNQLQVVDAVNLLPDSCKERVEVRFVAASADSDYKAKLIEKTRLDKKFVLCGGVPREKMVDVYTNSDLVVCCSTDDPLPVVVTEAMMYKCMFVTSSRTGHAALIKDGYNGFVYDVDNTEELTKKINFIMDGKIDINIVKNARITYQQNFEPRTVLEKFVNLLNSGS